MKKALMKDFWMEVRKSKARFLSIFFIVALGVAFFSGIQAASPDMRFSGDEYYDEKKLMDIKLIGTLGLTEADVTALSDIDGIEYAEGGWFEDVLCGNGDSLKVVHMESLSDSFNLPTIMDGRLPEKSGECFLDSSFSGSIHVKVGDTFLVREDGDDGLLLKKEFTVVGIGQSPLYISFNRGNTTLGSGEINGFAYIMPEDFEQDVYTQIYLKVHGAEQVISYTDAYENLIDRMKEKVEALEEERCAYRLDSVQKEAEEELKDGMQEFCDGEKEADEKLSDGWNQILDGEEEYLKGLREFRSGEKQLESGRKQLEYGRGQLNDGKKEFENGKKELQDAKDKISSGYETLNSSQNQVDSGWAELNDAEEKLKNGEKELSDGKAELEAGKKELEAGRAKWEDGKKELEAGRAKWEDGKKELEAGRAKWESGKAELEAGKNQLESGRKELEAGRAQLESGKAELESGKKELEAGRNQIEAAEILLNEKQTELNQAWEAYNSGKNQYETGLQQIETTKAELNDTKQQLEEGLNEISQAEQQIAGGRSEIANGRSQLLEQRSQLESAYGAGMMSEEEYLIQDGAISWAEAELDQKEAELNASESMLSLQKSELEGNLAAVNSGLAEIAGQEIYLESQAVELESALAQLNAGSAELESGWQELNARKTEIAAAELKIAASESQLAAAEAEILSGEKTLTEKEELIRKSEAELGASEKILIDSEAELNASGAEIRTSEAELNAAGQKIKTSEAEILSAEEVIRSSEEEMNAGKAEIEANKKKLQDAEAKLISGREELLSGEAELADGEKKLQDGEKEILENEEKLRDSEKTLLDSEEKLQDAKAELFDGWRELREGRREYAKGKKEAERELNEAEEEISDGKKKIKDIGMPEWFITTRNDLPEYSDYGDNAERIRNLGKVFPVIFFLVAALISLTTMTRMVEDQRTQIGTMKALGYGMTDIAFKYICYAFLATLGGSALGVLIGEKIIPWVIIKAYGIMYHNVSNNLAIDYEWKYALMASAAALFCTVGATLFSCYKELAETPASLMRPPAPKEGKRILLERITILWKHMNFTWKSSMRNLFRYKKRFFMTIFGIAGSMGLMLVGFGLHDSIMDVALIQYAELQHYDGTIIQDEDASNSELREMEEFLEKHEMIERYTNIMLSKMTATNGRNNVSAYVYVPEDLEKFKEDVTLKDRVTDTKYELTEAGAVICEKTASILGLSVGDNLRLQRDNKYYEIPVAVITENYMGHYVYLTPDRFSDTFGEEPEYSSTVFTVKDEYKDQTEEVGGEIMSYPAALSISYTSSLAGQIDRMLTTLGAVVIVLIVSAGMLAFVVLYNLNNINITERQRELATLKVLGFYDGEVSSYVFRENIILTLLGIAAGVFFGIALHRYTITTVEVDAVMFGRNVKPLSFLYCAVLTTGFSMIVNIFMHGKLKKINMVESLKSVE